MHLFYPSNNFWKASLNPLVWANQWPSSQTLSSQLSHNGSLRAEGNTKSHREQGLDYREAEELCWSPSCWNSLWQGWSCGLVHCPVGNATDPIWRMLASSDGISSWTSLKPQHSNPKPNPFGQSTLVFWLPYSSHTSQTPCLPWISYATPKLMLDSWKMVEKQSEAFHTFLRHFIQVSNRILLHIVLVMCPHVQIAFLKFTSCDNQALVGCFPITAVAVHLNLKS